jgi:CubicO group peptidase (beta-lactamase class C family)
MVVADSQNCFIAQAIGRNLLTRLNIAPGHVIQHGGITRIIDVIIQRYWRGDEQVVADLYFIILLCFEGFPNWRSDRGLRLETAPGEEFGYSGEGYEYLQKVVEHLTHQPLHVYLQSQLLNPLGMNNSTFAWGSDEAGNILLDEDSNVLPTQVSFLPLESFGWQGFQGFFAFDSE